jgi:DNA-binding NtrC family response regulator
VSTKRPRPSRDLGTETAPLAPERGVALAIHFVDDPTRSSIRIDRVLRIGRDTECDVRLDVESVSRVHAIVEPGSPPRIRDAGSRNGTFVGGERLADGETRAVTLGTPLRIGDAWLLVGPERSERTSKPAGAPLRVNEGPMGAVFDLADRLASDDITVLLTGETGVGKEVLAHYLHERSPRAAQPFVPVHAAALSPTLFESELFGHEKGSFTGASGERAGLFEQADGGTLFFDEIGELPLEMQPKLLRVLEDRRITRVGGRSARAVDVRIVAATNRDLAAEVARGAFRSDLYFRLSAFPLVVPPLRERKVEIAALARALVARAAEERSRAAPAIDDDAMKVLLEHGWPGNVRELRSVLTRALLFASEVIRERDVKMALGGALTRSPAPSPLAGGVTAPSSSSDDERAHIVAALARHAGNQAAAASDLGMARRTLLYKLDRLGIPRPRKRGGA